MLGNEQKTNESHNGASGAGQEGDGREMISLESLASLTGFPVEMIRSELFNREISDEKISLDELRKAMVNYIDATMLEGAES